MHDTSDAKPYLSLIIPAYNERSRIGASLKTVEAQLEMLGEPFEVIVVDDGSNDGTHELLKEQFGEFAALRIVSYEKNVGKGYAVRQGVYASRGRYVAFSDADLSAPVDQLEKLFASLENGYDIAIGSRAVKESVIPVRQPFYREMGGRGLNLVVQALATPGIHDTQCGFKLFRGEVARDVFPRCFLNGWGFDVEVLYLARRLGYSIDEVGVRWSHAEGSKIHPFRAGLQIVKDVVRIRAHSYGI